MRNRNESLTERETYAPSVLSTLSLHYFRRYSAPMSLESPPSLSDGSIRPSFHANDALCLCTKSYADSHLCSAATRGKYWVKNHISSNRHGVCDWSARLRSTSLRMSEGPRNRMVHALGVSHSVRKVKYLENRRLRTDYGCRKKMAYSSPI